MKKVLVITTSTGQGHNQAASTLCDFFEQEGFRATKIDFLSINSVILNKAVVNGYELGASVFPHIYGIVYKITNIPFINKSLTYPFLNAGKRVWEVIENEKPDIIVSTHPLGINMLHRFKKQGLAIPCISTVTDFKAHYTYISPLMDAYVTGSEHTKNSLISKGINPSVIYPTGIPINDIFFEKQNSIEMKHTNPFNILLMGGSMGLNKISAVLDELLLNEHNLNITVICGNNKKLLNSLKEKSLTGFKNKNVKLLGFTNDIPNLMNMSHLIISKPGGLTVTEAIAKNIPILIPFAIPGQEKENSEFLSQNGYAISVDLLSNINKEVDKLIQDPNILEKMRKNLSTISSTYDNRKIVEIAKELLK